MTNNNWFCGECGKLVLASQKRCPVCGTPCKGLSGIRQVVHSERLEEGTPIVRNKTDLSYLEKPTEWDLKYDQQ